ncbi:cytochrome c-type biogenesis protein [uncultured Thiodictyon sp.]|uniref:cytochrome c-type biogenesis protein n=1 Tax=uncultured Thiodictyon sp. TaxID=1846217 RepID=UPI0025CEDC50|nr:cytochrome c-type biogenesis protein [uncultured Thiodictyon sp.]
MSTKHLLAPALLGALLAWGLVPTEAPAASLQEFTFDTPAQEQAFRELTGKLRCLVCQNESLAASGAEVAQDLRRKVYTMMKEGKDQDAIVAFLVDRYGDFVLYQPPVKPSTYLLWFGPFILVGVGGFLLLRSLRRQGTAPEPTLSPADEARIAQLLAAGDDQQDRAK